MKATFPRPHDFVYNSGELCICAETFRATGTVFVCYYNAKDSGDYEARRYVQCSYATLAEWEQMSR